MHLASTCYKNFKKINKLAKICLLDYDYLAYKKKLAMGLPYVIYFLFHYLYCKKMWNVSLRVFKIDWDN